MDFLKADFDVKTWKDMVYLGCELRQSSKRVGK